jgi:hypothetical protein
MKAILTHYLGQTDTKGSRIVAEDDDGNRVVIPYPYELRTEAAHRLAARKLCLKMGWTGRLASGGIKNGYAFVFLN